MAMMARAVMARAPAQPQHQEKVRRALQWQSSWWHHHHHHQHQHHHQHHHQQRVGGGNSCARGPSFVLAVPRPGRRLRAPRSALRPPAPFHARCGTTRQRLGRRQQLSRRRQCFVVVPRAVRSVVVGDGGRRGRRGPQLRQGQRPRVQDALHVLRQERRHRGVLHGALQRELPLPVREGRGGGAAGGRARVLQRQARRSGGPVGRQAAPGAARQAGGREGGGGAYGGAAN
mmetsp:Transcript_56958/g.114204  ORF Transcript_56958/g.114204 Transcript_56958/m.114204 type:complete len:230 (+) Transcript_56958:1477-2166(+)